MKTVHAFAFAVFVLFLLVLPGGCNKDDENILPHCSFTSPGNLDTLTIDSLVVIRIKGSDEDGIVSSLRLLIEGEEVKEVSTTELNYVWDTEDLGAGEKQLRAEVTDNDGATSSTSITVFLKGNFAPVPVFSIQPDTGDVQQPFTFDASATTDPDDPAAALQFRWDWEDDGTFDTPWDADPTAQHIYSLPGSYTVRLEVRDSKGLSAQTTRNLVATGQATMSPVAAFTISPGGGNTQQTFTVNAGGSYDPDGLTADLSYRWDWDGDGTWDTPYLSDTLASQKYGSPGTYRIRLQVRDGDMLTDTVSHTVVVSQAPVGGQPCPGIPAIVYSGKQYTTVQVGSQCWLKENLDVGTMINSSFAPSNNPVFEKYCYNDIAANCQIFGGLYTWDEAMKYTSLPQGICPMGWHIASDADYKLLEGRVDSQYDSLSTIWDSTGFRGFDAGLQLRSTSAWTAGGNGPDVFGFTAFPAGGAYGPTVTFAAQGSSAMFWTSDPDGSLNAMARYLDAAENGVYREGFQRVNAFSVRCIKD